MQLDITNATVSARVDRAMEDMKVKFRAWDHHPNEEQLDALMDIPCAIMRMAEGNLDRQVYMSPCACGLGKTTAIISSFKVLLEDGFDDGALVCLQRLEQIEDFIREAGLAPEDIGVYTSDVDVNNLSAYPNHPELGRVFITTHRMITARCVTKDQPLFADVAQFHYQGKPRPVRVWDESLDPGEALQVDRANLKIIQAILEKKRLWPLAESVQGIIDVMQTAPYDDTGRVFFRVPELDRMAGSDTVGPMHHSEVRQLMVGSVGDSEQRAAETLWKLSGMGVTIYKTTKKGYPEVALDYRDDLLPPDLLPILVTDASGELRGVYKDQSESRGNVVMLAPARKRYDNATIHLLNKGGGKSSFKNRPKAMELVTDCYNEIMRCPDEEHLIFYHKPNDAVGNFNVKRELKKLLHEEVFSRCHFVTFGLHDATNAYAHVRRIIFAGVLYQDTAFYEARKRMTKGVHSADGRLTKEQIAEAQKGELAHLFLQAGNRGVLRKCLPGGNALEADVFVIGARNRGVNHALFSEVFPGATIKEWRPDGTVRAYTGKVGLALEYIDEMDRDWISFKEVMEAVEISDASTFRKRVRQHPDFIEGLAIAGYFEDGRGFSSRRRAAA